MSSYTLYVERIYYPPVAFWSSTSSWCRCTGWRLLVDVSIRGQWEPTCLLCFWSLS